MEEVSISLDIREMNIRTTVKCKLIPVTKAVIQRMLAKLQKHKELLYTVGGHVSAALGRTVRFSKPYGTPMSQS